MRISSVSITSSIYHFFVLGEFKILSASCFEIQLIVTHSHPIVLQNIRSHSSFPTPRPIPINHPLPVWFYLKLSYYQKYFFEVEDKAQWMYT
jgi:hypothetical protein